MKYVFFGTSVFSVTVLKKLLEAGFIPEAVVSSPDRPVGRRRVITPPLVKAEIHRLGIKTVILQPEQIDEQFLEQLKEINADFYLVAAYAKILPKKLLAIPPLGVMGVHPSLLPKFRGPSPIQSAILEGAKEMGVTLFLLDEKMDHGPILTSWKIAIGDETFEALREKLANIAGDLLIVILPKFLNGELKPEPQNGEATYTKKFETQDAYVEPNDLKNALDGDYEKALEIDRKVRALNPEPGVFTLSPPALSVSNGSKGGPRRIKILETKIVDNRLKLVKIQEAGKKPVILT